MRSEPAEILRQFLDSAFHPARAESLIAPDAVFIDLSPTGNAMRRGGGSGTVVGKQAFLDATAQLLKCTSSGELVINSLFCCGGSVAGFGTMVRCGAHDPYQTSAPVSLWAKVMAGRMRFFQYMEFNIPHALGEVPPARGSRPALVQMTQEEPVKLLTFQR
ncbi:nuclear transport factor 2 family protein [Rhizobium ruizarguesonis]